MDRLEGILIQACNISGDEPGLKYPMEEYDTSCSNVPLGYVKIIREDVSKIESSDKFWSIVLACDGGIELIKARILPFESTQIVSVLKVIQKELTQVGQKLNLQPFVGIDECFEVRDACDYCCGRILLLKNDKEIFYIHWHRES